MGAPSGTVLDAGDGSGGEAQVTARILLILLLALAAPACGGRSTWEVENRETQVNCWLTAPDSCAQAHDLDALIYIGPYKVVQGPVEFPKGTPTVNLPPVYIRAGCYDVAAVIDGGRYSVREQITISKESWVQVILRGGRLRLNYSERQPDPWGR